MPAALYMVFFGALIRSGSASEAYLALHQGRPSCRGIEKILIIGEWLWLIR